MTRWQLGGQHAFAVVYEVVAFQNWQLVPAVPIDFAILRENRIKASFVEWNVLPGMLQQLGKLTALEGEHLLRQPILAFYQHIENFFLHFAHQANSRTKRCCLPPALRGISASLLYSKFSSG